MTWERRSRWPTLIGLRLYVVHVGDSRCYLFRDGGLHQVTRDHTMAQVLVDEGQLAPELVEKSPLSHVLWNAVGGIRPQFAQARCL